VVFGSMLLAPFPVAAETRNILQNKCGDTKNIEIWGGTFGKAVKEASQNHGKQSWKKIKGKCNVKNGGARVTLPMVLTSGQKCEIKFLTGGKSHSRMKKQCAILGWLGEYSDRSYKDGIGGSWKRKIYKKPTNNTRQKSWHLKLSANRPSPPPGQYVGYAFEFEITKVRLKIPASSSLTNSSSFSVLRQYCFK
jgi:hypothetical protein